MFYASQPASRILLNTTITLSGISQATPAFGPQTRQVRVATGAQPAFVVIGDGTPVADATAPLFGANIVDYLKSGPGQRAAVLQAGTGGLISISEIE